MGDCTGEVSGEEEGENEVLIFVVRVRKIGILIVFSGIVLLLVTWCLCCGYVALVVCDIKWPISKYQSSTRVNERT